MVHCNTIWVSGTPRTGSMWTTNIVREILKCASFKVFPKTQIQSDEEWLKLFNNYALKDLNRNNMYVCKVHSLLKQNVPRSRIVVNIRNPFEICASYKEFMKCDWKSAVLQAKQHLDVIQHYRSHTKLNTFFIRYEDIENDSIDVILHLAKFLGVKIDTNIAKIISIKFSKANVKKIIKNTETSLISKIENNQSIPENEIVHLSDSNFRAFNLETGFQTGHVSNRKSGEWRHVFSFNEIPKILYELNPIAEKLGYNKEIN